MGVSNNFGKELKRLRTERHVSHRAQTAMTGVDVGNLCRYENGRIDMTVGTAMRILDALGCRLTITDKKDD